VRELILSQSSKTIRSSGGLAQFVNDQSVQKNGANASANVVITFQKSGECQDLDTDSEDGVSVSILDSLIPVWIVTLPGGEQVST